MSGFAVRIAIDTPVVLNNLLHFDGLLGRLLALRGDDPAHIPLRRVDRVYCGSVALLETGPFGPVEYQRSRIKRLRGEDNCVAGANSLQAAMDAMSSFRPRLSVHRLYESVSAIWFCGQGDHARVADLLHDLRSIGSMASCGYGRVIRWEMMSLQDSDEHGLLLQNGLPARAVPVTLWRRMDLPEHPRAVIAQQACTPPYWRGDQEICIAPLLVDLTGTRPEIAGLIGLGGERDMPRAWTSACA